jgi:hypothetical protein
MGAGEELGVDDLGRLCGGSRKSSARASDRCSGGGAAPRAGRQQSGAGVSSCGRRRKEAARLRRVPNSGIASRAMLLRGAASLGRR